MSSRLMARSSNKFSYVRLGIFLATLYWFVESAIHSFALGYGSYFSQLLTTDPHELWKRLLVAALLIAFGLSSQRGINALRRTETARATSEKKYQTLFQEAMNPIFVLDKQGQFKEYNQATLGFFECSGSDLLSTRYQELASLSTAERRRDPSVPEESPMSYEVEHSVNDHMKTLLLNVAPVRFEDSPPLYFAIGQDISERKLAETNLTLAHAELNQIFQTASSAMRLIDNEFNVLKVNQTFASLSGVTAEDAIGEKCYDVFAGDCCHSDKCPLNRVLDGEAEIDLEVNKLHRDGTPVPCLLTARPFLAPDGAPLGIVESFKDIAELKSVQEELRTERDRLRSILFQQFEGVGIVRRDFTLEYQNSALTEEIGDFQGEPCYSAFLKNTVPCPSCLMHEALSSGRPQQREFTTSAQRVYEHTYTPFRDANGEEKVLVLLRDISDRKASRAAIIRSEQLAAIGELAAGVAHEINNPINGVLNYAELLIEGHPQLETVHELANMIVSEGERVAKIVKSLLDFSRRDSEYRIAVDFGQLLPDTLTITNALLRSSFITVNVDIADDLPQIVCVPQEIQQVFVNLVNNARDALNQKYPLGGPDKILDIAAQIEQVDHDQFVTIAFHDHGSGIPADLIDKVTSPFFSTKPQGYGTGLGLTISHEIIAAHGGRLVIESREGDYTKVAVRLPVAPSAAESDSHDQGPHLSC